MEFAAQLIDRIRASVGLPGGTRIVCAMSGGVDSSVSAALLKLAGYEVVGITLQLYDHGQASARKGACCAVQDIHDARRVAQALKVPHYVLDFEERFRAAVIDDFVASYLDGLTPIPCVRCNQTVKFADLLMRARELGAAALATGHYAASAPAGDSGRRDLLTPADMARDQSYFLFATTGEQLEFLRFPLGALAKPETRRIAAKLGLPVADKPDSQDICFVPHGRYTDVIAQLAPHAAQPGDIVHVDGRVLGRHPGIMHFTVGQRRGLRIGNGEPLHVVAIDAARRRVLVGPRAALLRHEIELAAVNWLGAKALSDQPRPVFVKIRSAHGPVPAAVSARGPGALVTLAQGESGVAPGQACVFYERPGPHARVLGGGVIAGARNLSASSVLPDAAAAAT